MVSLPNLAPGQQQLSRQILEPEAEQVLPERVSDFDPKEVAEALQANPDIAQVYRGWWDFELTDSKHITGASQTD